MPWDDAAIIDLPSRSEGEPPAVERAEGAAPRPAQDTTPQNAVLRYEYRGAQVVEAQGEYDLHSVGPLADALWRAVETHPMVILDASRITFADSSALNLMLLVHRTGKLRVTAPSAQVQRLCAITGADGVLQIRDTIADAVAG
ncbi:MULTISPECIES: STAS domain-containing protein [Streptomyces]|uniref:Anti-sigma factor antagonist n=1 Tax=Streptomyces venezuelae (strain ATCC 10712 / CBS 650.69 / DSM 40230 / JCM 4526 / NBRC 13096 / PD 04745) TaxID=953739 RepID=F2R0Y8_STRVP|nr:STAS domain-containing protein [Streptomyces venezuelae]QER98861.1 anti-sigma factor antagonist [Streptomyces venezuelae ATCC 10712]CCA55505.1 anti-sigma factor antagonist [Streptomyces venezuelae ATCC 10712]